MPAGKRAPALGANAADRRPPPLGRYQEETEAMTKIARFGRSTRLAKLAGGAVLCASMALTATLDTANARGWGGHGYGGYGHAGHGYGGHGYGGHGYGYGRGYYGGYGYGRGYYGGHGYGYGGRYYGTRYYAGYSGDWQTPKPRLCKSMRCLLTD
jgi:hypothetical protein